MAEPALAEKRRKTVQSTTQPQHVWIAIAAMFAIGIFFFVFALIAWNHGEFQSTKVITSSPTTTAPASSASSASTTTTFPSPTATTTVPAAITSTPTILETNTTPQSTTTTSDTFLIALISFGALFVLVAAFFNRISSITLPGGAAIQLTAEGAAEATGSVADKTAHISPPTHRKAVAKKAFQLVVAEVGSRYDAESLDEAELDRIAGRAVSAAEAMQLS